MQLQVILSKTRRSEEDFERFLFIIESKIEIIPRSEFDEFLKEAKKVCKRDDSPFVTLDKALDCNLRTIMILKGSQRKQNICKF